MIERIFCIGFLWMAVFAGLHFEILSPLATLFAWFMAWIATFVVMATAQS